MKMKKKNKKNIWIKGALGAALVLGIVMLSVPVSSAAADAFPETAFVEGEVMIISDGEVTPGYDPTGDEIKDDKFDPSAQVNSDDDFKSLWDKWQDGGYPANVAGVTQDRYEMFGGEIIITHTENEYTVLVLDDSDEAIAELRSMYTEQDKIYVNFARSCVTSSGESVEMRYSYNELSEALAEISANMDAMGHSLGRGGVASANINVISNSVEITIRSYYDSEKSSTDENYARELGDYYSSKYGNIVTVMIRIDNYEGIGNMNGEVVTMPALADEIMGYSPADIGVVAENDHRFILFFAVALLVAATTLGCSFISHYRSRKRVPLLAVGDKSRHGTKTATAVSERELLDKISETAAQPSDSVYVQIMAKRGNGISENPNKKF